MSDLSEEEIDEEFARVWDEHYACHNDRHFVEECRGRYHYGTDAMEQVRFGYGIAVKHRAQPPAGVVLSEEEREALVYIRDFVESDGGNHGRWAIALAVLDRLLASPGAAQGAGGASGKDGGAVEEGT